MNKFGENILKEILEFSIPSSILGRIVTDLVASGIIGPHKAVRMIRDRYKYEQRSTRPVIQTVDEKISSQTFRKKIKNEEMERAAAFLKILNKT